jgi:hypothetical protein
MNRIPFTVQNSLSFVIIIQAKVCFLRDLFAGVLLEKALKTKIGEGL